jgi:hypothetical protein
MGVGVVGLFANFFAHLLNPSIILLQSFQLEEIVVLELVGMGLSFAIRKQQTSR